MRPLMINQLEVKDPVTAAQPSVGSPVSITNLQVLWIQNESLTCFDLVDHPGNNVGNSL